MTQEHEDVDEPSSNTARADGVCGVQPPRGLSGDLERRLQQIMSTIQEFAVLRFDARAEIGSHGDLVDAVAAGVNFLGEELDASFREIESRVVARTADLEVATEALRWRALHDGLTGMANRTLFWDRLAHRLATDDRRSAGFAVLFIDLDQFKEINDTLGHAVGDRLLVDVAARIRTSLRGGDSAARVGGDEFLILLDEVHAPADAVGVAGRLVEALHEPYTIGGDQRVLGASIGIAVSTGRTWTADSLVAAADTAMYDAKSRSRGQCVLFNEQRHGHARPSPG